MSSENIVSYLTRGLAGMCNRGPHMYTYLYVRAGPRIFARGHADIPARCTRGSLRIVGHAKNASNCRRRQSRAWESRKGRQGLANQPRNDFKRCIIAIQEDEINRNCGNNYFI